jgi:pimeloyl-ACP methyl ester carboxylesterase
VIRRTLLTLLVLVAAAIGLPPLWFSVFRAPPPALPAPGRHVALANGDRLNVIEQGEGPPIVLVHGLPGSAYDWRLLTDALARRGRRVFAYDRAGYGHSDPPRERSYTFERNAEDLLALLAALDLRAVTVVGWSYGGGAALVAARRDPSRLAGLVLVGSVGPGSNAHAPSALVTDLTTGPVLAWARSVPPFGRWMTAAISADAFSGQPQPGWWLPDMLANMAQAESARSYASEMRSYPAEPVPDSSGLALPVLVIHGELDRLVPISVGRELARHAPNGRLDEIAGGSHMLPVTHAERLAEEIAEFSDE